jgi:N-acyl-phosphatidylethanolamine-hydrolysing phospholipase D
MMRGRRSRFSNPWATRPPPGHNNVVRWALTHWFARKPDGPEPVVASAAASFVKPEASHDELTVTWIGHSTTLVQIGGLNVLTDPVWAERASPVSFVGPRRRLPPAIELNELPRIDVVVISHDHYDHLDLGTVARLAARCADTQWLAPLGVGGHLRTAGARRVDELAWWEDRTVGAVSFGCTPAQHSSGRGLADRNRSLWCGWTMTTTSSPRRAVYFAGDTAYCPAFVEIGTRVGPFDACLLPIGAYEPRWYMRYVHMTPEEAVRAFEELCQGSVAGSCLVPIHWGTFRIADDALDEPPRRLLAEWKAAQLPPSALAMLAHGETRHWTVTVHGNRA